jgi:hypothetical protein
MEYVDKQINIEANERQAREKLSEVRKQVRHTVAVPHPSVYCVGGVLRGVIMHSSVANGSYLS